MLYPTIDSITTGTMLVMSLAFEMLETLRRIR